MADVVQFRLERMADNLDDLVKRGLCTRAEIAVIVKRRRDFEYRIKRPSPLKQDFLLYIEFEKKFDRLLYLQQKVNLDKMKENEEEEGEGIVKKKKGKKGNKSIPNVYGVNRILELYRMAIVRFKGDLELLFQCLEFCRERRHGKMKKVLAQALQFHPKVPGLWIYAAAWQFDQNLNVAAARNLMQSGLRACPNSEDLWIEYLRMELTYLNKLKARKIVLGEVRDVGEVNQWKEENTDLFMSLEEEKDDTKGSDLQEGASEKKNDIFGKQGLAILQTIYREAVKALPSSMSLRKRFLEVLDTVNLAHFGELRKEIMEDFKKDFSHDELYWDWIARQEIVGTSTNKDEFLSKLNKAIEIYEEALSISPSSKMFTLYIKFWFDTLSDSLLKSIGIDATQFNSSILEVFEKAESSGLLTEDNAYQYILFYLQMGRIEEARNLAEKLCNGRFFEGADLWSLRISIEVKSIANKAAPMSKDEMNLVFDLFKNVLTRISVCKAERLWIMALKIFSNDKGHFEKLIERFMWELAKAGAGDSGYSISSAIVNWVFQRDGMRHARKVYNSLLALPRPSLAFFKHCIELETNLAVVGQSDAAANVRRLYQSALSYYDQNIELWRDYYTLEMKIGTSETTYAVYWRARKTLKDLSGLSSLGYL